MNRKNNANNSSRKKKYASRNRVLFQDVVFSMLASLLSILFLRWMTAPYHGFTTRALIWLGVSLVASFTGALVSGSFNVIKRYTNGFTLHRIIFSIVVKEALMFTAVVVGLVRVGGNAECALLILADTLITTLFLMYFRWTARQLRLEHETVETMAGRQTAVIHGTHSEAIDLMEQIEHDGRYQVVAFITSDPKLSGRIIDGKPVYYCVDETRMEQLQWMFGGIDCVFYPRNIRLEKPDPSISGEVPDASSDIPMPDQMTLVQYMVKRAFDISLSAVLLVVFSPLLLICAIAIKLEDGGEVFFRQERVGRGGATFYIYKLRTMRADAEKGNPLLCSGAEDERLTRVGRFFRQHHLDELPQLYNVLKGDMSFIGYRPERSYYIKQIMEQDSRYRYLYQIRPGVTSYATLYNGYTDTLEKMLRRLELDLYYLRNHSLLFDAKVLGLTFLSIVGGKKF